MMATNHTLDKDRKKISDRVASATPGMVARGGEKT
jgi:hypothetical protein